VSVISRLAVWLVLGGLLVGAVLRVVLGRGRFAALLVGALTVPWVLHAGYVAVQAAAHGAAWWGVLAFLAVGAALAVAALLLARRWLQPHGLWAALLPALLAAVYGLGPFLVMSVLLRRSGIDLDVVPTATYLGTSLFAAAALLPFAPRTDGARLRWPWRRR